MSEERGYSMQVVGRFIIKSKECIGEHCEDVQSFVQKEINKALRFVNSKFKCEIMVDEVTHSMNFGGKKGVNDEE